VGGFWRILSAFLRGAFVVASPLVLYVAVAHCTLATGTLLVVAWAGLRLLVSLWSRLPAEQKKAALVLPGIALASALLGFVTQDRRALLLLPSATQFGFALAFARTLGSGQTPLIEHFARMQKPWLPEEEVGYCRRLTVVWAVALVLAGLFGLVLSVYATPGVWALWSGVGCYAFVGTLFGVEWLFRQMRFRRPDGNWLARWLYRRAPREFPPAPEGATQGSE
jgi:uncharacterized membrane protein